MASRFADWLYNGAYAADHLVFDVGGTTRTAIARHRAGTPALEAGPAHEADNGNGALMRILPISLWMSSSSTAQQVRVAHDASRVTHGHLRSQVCCAIYSCLVSRLLAGSLREDAWLQAFADVRSVYAEQQATVELGELELIRSFAKPNGSGYVVDCLHSAWHAVRDAADYPCAIRAAVRFGHDTDTTAAVAGGLAGLVFGLEGVPASWRAELRLDGQLRKLLKSFEISAQVAAPAYSRLPPSPHRPTAAQKA